MSDPVSQTDDEPVSMRQELARVQEAARRALSHQTGEQDMSRESRDLARDVDSVTEQMALEQELDTVRQTLSEKENVVDDLEARCRRLEDQLEDQHLAYDELKQELERKKRSLSAAREQLARANEERREIDERYQALLSSAPSAGTAGDSRRARRRAIRSEAPRFAGGMVSGLVLAVVAYAAWVHHSSRPLPELRSFAVPEVAAPAAAPAPSVRPSAEATAVEAEAPVVEEGQSRPLVLGRVRDRLSDGSTGPLMLVLQGGGFTMGRQRALPYDDAVPAHQVLLGGFLISATEVTFDEYDRFARATGRRFPNDFGWGRGTRPVVDVSWTDARAYAQWLSASTEHRYRLPSESEWEYIAAAGRRSFFWWGDQVGPDRAVCFDCGTIWDNQSSAPVGSFAPSPLGLYDTAGNVMEWVEDCYHPNYEGAPANGQPRGEDGCPSRVARGGAFNKPARSMRPTSRHHFSPDTRISALGFRLARDE